MKRILLIDDSEIVRESISAALEDAGYDVTALAEPARELFTEAAEPPDLVLMDVNMPEMYGDDVAVFLRETWPSRPPIHLISDIDETELAERAREADADGYVCKAWGLERIVEVVHGILDLEGARAVRTDPR